MKILLIFLFPTFLFAQEIPSYCEMREIPLKKNVVLSKVPDYFFKPVWPQNGNDGRDDVSIILEGGNYILNMQSGQLEEIPGPYDGVPTPDGEFIVSPANGDHIQFFDRNGIKADSQALYDDQNSENPLYGVYHSLGVLNKKQVGNSKQVTYRAITDTVTSDQGENSLQFKEYTFEIAPNGEKKLIKASKEPKLLCSNFKSKLIKTPIISKDGSMLSAYNEETGTSVIFDISIDQAGKSICRIKKDLGFAASKMEFSPDGSRVVFAMNSLPITPTDVDWYAQPPTDTHNMNVFTYDFKSDVMRRISNQEKGNAYYPSFSQNGEEVVYLSQEIKNENFNYSVKRVALTDAPAADFFKYSDIASCKLVDKDAITLMALGHLWASICSEFDKISSSAAAMIPLSMSKENCVELVKNKWSSFSQESMSDLLIEKDTGKNKKTILSDTDTSFYKNEILNVNQQDLINTCKALRGKNESPPPVDKIMSFGGEDDEFEPEASCTQCHAANSTAPFIPFDNPEELPKYKNKMLLHVMTGNMPKNMKLSTKNREKLIEYLNGIKDPVAE
jgi:hypothetical protein